MRWIRIVGLDRDRLHLLTGAIADIKRRNDFALIAGIDDFLLALGCRATTRRLNRFKMHRSRASVLIFEMRDCCLVANRGMKVDGVLFPFQFSARGDAKKDRQCKSQDAGFHFFE